MVRAVRVFLNMYSSFEEFCFSVENTHIDA
jgi:hypothetical protein